MIENKVYYTELFDCYGTLFSEHSQNYFYAYFNEDMSLSEIAQRYEVSRAAVSKQLKHIKILLDEYESNLNLLQIYKVIDYIAENNSKLSKDDIVKMLEKFGGL